jgi:hypothetical protein
VESHEIEQNNILPNLSYNIFDGKSCDIKLNGFEAHIPKNVFYRDMTLSVTKIDTIQNIFSDYAYRLGSNEIPLHKKIKIRIKVAEEFVDDTLLYVAAIDKNGKLSYLGNKYNDDFIEAQTNVLGTYLIAKDEIKPTIKPLNFKSGGTITENWSQRLEIEDKESGIDKYEMLVNGEWVLAEYDAKNNLLIYQIDNHIKKGHNTLEVIVTDMLGNKRIYSTTLQR